MDKERRRNNNLNADEVLALLLGTLPAVYRRGQVFSDVLGNTFIIVRVSLKREPFFIRWHWTRKEVLGHFNRTCFLKSIKDWHNSTHNFHLIGRENG